MKQAMCLLAYLVQARVEHSYGEQSHLAAGEQPQRVPQPGRGAQLLAAPRHPGRGAQPHHRRRAARRQRDEAVAQVAPHPRVDVLTVADAVVREVAP